MWNKWYKTLYLQRLLCPEMQTEAMCMYINVLYNLRLWLMDSSCADFYISIFHNSIFVSILNWKSRSLLNILFQIWLFFCSEMFILINIGWFCTSYFVFGFVVSSNFLAMLLLSAVLFSVVMAKFHFHSIHLKCLWFSLNYEH